MQYVLCFIVVVIGVLSVPPRYQLCLQFIESSLHGSALLCSLRHWCEVLWTVLPHSTAEQPGWIRLLWLVYFCRHRCDAACLLYRDLLCWILLMIAAAYARMFDPAIAQCRHLAMVHAVSYLLLIYIQFSFPYCLFVSNSQVIGCEDRLRNDLYCVGCGVKLCSIQSCYWYACCWV